MGEIKRKMLIVDDAELNRVLLSQIFLSRYEILEAENGKKAIEILHDQNTEIEIVLMDICMPEMDGYTVLEHMHKNNWNEIPVILISADLSDEVVEKGYNFGMTDIITKPFMPQIVRRRVNNVVEQFAYRRNLNSLINQQAQRLRQQEHEDNILTDMLCGILSDKPTQYITNMRKLTRLLLYKLIETNDAYDLDNDSIKSITIAAALCNIGQSTLPDILRVVQPQSIEERKLVEAHTVRGSNLIKEIKEIEDLPWYPYCVDICQSHHERWNGSGFPQALIGNAIPIWAQIVGLADTFLSALEENPFTDAIDKVVAGEYGSFNPDLLDCLRVLPDNWESINVISEYAPARPKSMQKHAEKHAERLVRLVQEERKQYTLIADWTGEILMNYDIDQDKLEFSEQFEKNFGISGTFYEASKTLAKCGIFMEEDKQDVLNYQDRTSPNQPVYFKRIRLRALDGQVEWFLVYGQTIWDRMQPPVCHKILGKLVNIRSLRGEII